MAGNLIIQMILRARDEASRVVNRGLSDIGRQSQAAGRAMNATMRETQRAGRAREVLGIRSERMIRREIQQTEAAYNRLARSGTASQRELARASEAARNRVRELNREMNGGRPGMAGRMLGGANRLLQGGTSVAMGAMAGGYIIGQPIKRTIDWDMRLAHMSNTAYVGKDLATRRMGMKTLEGYVNNATNYGGSRDSAAQALDNIIASGIVSTEEAGAMLPTIVNAATASNTDASELSSIVLAAVQNSKIKPEDVDKILGKALLAGQLGGFELKDMARGLPTMLAMSSNSGVTGLKGLDSVLAAAQLSVTTAGSTDQATTNMLNLLNKLNSADTNKRFAQLHFDESSGTIRAAAGGRKDRNRRKGGAKESGIDLAGSLAAGREKGQDSIEVFVGLLQKIVEGDKHYQALRKKAESSKNDEDKQQVYSAMGNILRARGVSDAIVDQQALLALIGILNNIDRYKELKTQIGAADGSVIETNAQLVREQTGYKIQQLLGEKEKAETEAFRGMTETVGDVSEKLTAYAGEYPALTSALTGATYGLTALAATAAVSSMANLAMSGGAARQALGGLGGMAGRTSGLLGAMKGPVMGVGSASLATQAGLLGLSLAVGIAAGTLANRLISSGLTKLNDGKETTIGTAFYDWVHGEETPLNEKIQRFSSKNTNQIKSIGMSIPGLGPLMMPAVEMLSRHNAPSPVAPVPQSGGTTGSAAGTPGANATPQLSERLVTQLGMLQQASDNAPVTAGLDRVASGISQLAAKPSVTNVTTVLQVDGATIARSVNAFNTTQQARG